MAALSKRPGLLEFAIFILGRGRAYNQNQNQNQNQGQNLGALHYDTGAHQVSKCIIRGKLEEGQKHDSILNHTDEQAGTISVRMSRVRNAFNRRTARDHRRGRR